MEKTIREWLEMLPEPYRTQAIENGDRFNGDRGTDVMNCRPIERSLSSAIKSAFIWDKSAQGQTYWESICSRAERGEFDPKEPQS